MATFKTKEFSTLKISTCLHCHTCSKLGSRTRPKSKTSTWAEFR